MLQTRFENEQFNSLPLLFTTNRLRNDYITTDRPDSSQLVDLHIYIIPKTVWKNVQHLAQNEAMDDAISAGFVRVSPDMKLRYLRESIEISCGKENNFPREFIFLRSVGRCLTRVKQTQENELKVKNYRPPQTLASEIYLLEGRHEDYGNIPSASPALSSASYLFGSRQYRFNLDQELSRLAHHYDRKPLRSEKDILPALTTNHVTYRRPLSSRKSGSRFTHIGLDLDGSPPNTCVVTSVIARDLNKLKEEQERLRRRQAELDRIRRAAEEKKLDSEREENERQRRREQLEREENERQRRLEQLEREENELQRRREQLEREENERQRRREQLEREEDERQRRRQEKEQLDREEKERQRRRQEKEQLEREEKERQRRRQEKERLERDEQERRRQQRRQQKAEAERRRSEKLELAATTIQASFRGFQERQTFRERQRNFKKNDFRKSPRNEKITDINDDEFSDGSHIISRTSIGSTSDLDSNPSRPETRTIKRKMRESIHSNSSSLLSMKIERKNRSNTSSSSSLHLKTEDLSIKNNLDNDDDERSATVTKTRHSDEEILPESTSDINDDDTYELKRRAADAKQNQQSEEERRKAKELEDQRRRESSKRQLPQDVESLRARLEELRTERANFERVRDEVIIKLRHMHQRITLRRRDARDMWKKKYFQEKKKTPAIEERSTQLKTDLELIHGKTVQIIDNEIKHAAQVGSSKETDIENSMLKITRIQYEMQDIQHQLDQAKLRLTTDLKLRNQADNECQLLKHELIQAKMNLNHIKNRITV